MPITRIQGPEEKLRGIYYEYDSSAKPLGEGGMAIVYKGSRVEISTSSTIPVAIKRVKSPSEEVVEKARREGSIKLRNDNLIEMMGFIECSYRTDWGSQKNFYIVSEYLDGVPLDDVMQGKITNQEGYIVPLAQELAKAYQENRYQFAVTVVRSVLSGLSALHDEGYIHRDIDPGNIMVTMNGRIKLMDLGLARRIDYVPSKVGSKFGVFIGKPQSAAPESVLGDIFAQNPATDLYAVGILLYHCIVGHPPFEGNFQEVLEMQLKKRPPLKDICNRNLREIIGKAMEKKNAKRYQTSAEFRAELDKLPRPLTDDPVWMGLMPKVIVALVLCLCLAGIVKFGLHRPDKPDNEDDKDSTTELPQKRFDLAKEYLAQGDLLAEEGLRIIDSLVNAEYAPAAHLLGQLLAIEPSELGYQLPDGRPLFPESISNLRLKAGIEADTAKALRLLERTTELDPVNYQVLIEWGCAVYYYLSKDDATQKQRALHILKKVRPMVPVDDRANSERVQKIIDRINR